jgi:putative membrane protein
MCKNDLGPIKVDGTISDTVSNRNKFLIQIFFMKKIFGSIAGVYLGSIVMFYVILLSCNSNDTTETTDATTNTATDATASTASSTTNVVTDEKSSDFLKKATNSGMAEVQLAKLAQQKATIDAVKNFAAMLERDHTAVNDQVKTLAGQRNVSLPAAPSDDKQKMYTDMEKKAGKDFDKEYISMMVKSHNDGISLFEDTKSNASDVDVKNFADKTLPTLKMHLDSAKAIQKRYW